MAMVLASWLHLAGCSLACQGGVLSNFEFEVGPALNACTVGRSGIGLSQWAGARRKRLIATFGRDWCNPQKQIEFVITELREMGLLDRLFRATDPGEAARLFMLDYLRPRSRNPGPRQRRAWAIFHMRGGQRR